MASTASCSLSNHPALDVFRRSGMGLCNESTPGRLSTPEAIARALALGEHVYTAACPGARLNERQAVDALRSGSRVYTHGS